MRKIGNSLLEGKENSWSDVVEVDGGELSKIGVDPLHVGREKIAELSGELDSLRAAEEGQPISLKPENALVEGEEDGGGRRNAQWVLLRRLGKREDPSSPSP